MQINCKKLILLTNVFMFLSVRNCSHAAEIDRLHVETLLNHSSINCFVA